MADRTCASCGARVGILVDQCPGCGRDPDLRLIELGVGTGRRRGDRSAPGQPRPGGGPGPGWRRWAPIVAGAVGLWGFLAFTAGDDQRDEGATEQAEPARSSTSGKEAERTPPTRRGSRVDTTTTSVVPGAPLLGRQTGLQLVLVGERSRIVDLDSGVTTSMPSTLSIWAVSGGRLLVSDRYGLAWWPAPYDGTGAELLDVPNIEQAWVDPGGELVWYMTSGSSGPRLFRLSADGEEPVEQALSRSVWPVGTVPGGIVLNAPGGVFVLDGAGDVRHISTGSAIATSGDRIYVDRCTGELECAFEIVGVDGEVLDRRPGAAGDEYPFGPFGFLASVSPDGRQALLVEVDGRPGLAVDGEVVDGVSLSSGLGGASWAPDSEWLFLATAGGSVYAIDADAAAVVADIDPGAGGSVWQVMVIAG